LAAGFALLFNAWRLMRRGNVLASTSSVGNCDKDDGFAETVLGSQGKVEKLVEAGWNVSQVRGVLLHEGT